MVSTTNKTKNLTILLDVEKIIRHEEQRLKDLVQKNLARHKANQDNIDGYIVGVAQLAANLSVLIGNRKVADEDAKICWKCGNVLETEKATDYSGDPVDKCCECGAFIRD